MGVERLLKLKCMPIFTWCFTLKLVSDQIEPRRAKEPVQEDDKIKTGIIN